MVNLFLQAVNSAKGNFGPVKGEVSSISFLIA